MNWRSLIFVVGLIGLASSFLSAQETGGKKNPLSTSNGCSEKLAGTKPRLKWPKRPLISDCMPMNLETTFAPQPLYPEVAMAVRAYGIVLVEVVIGKNGRVMWAKVVAGHPLISFKALEAACKTRFKPMRDCLRRKVRMATILHYNFKLESATPLETHELISSR